MTGTTDRGELLAGWKERTLDARLSGTSILPPAGVRDACQQWLSEAIPSDGRPAQGLDSVGLPPAWRDPMAWCGVPIAAGGSLRWGIDLREEAVEVPAIIDRVLVLPPPEALAHLTSLALKPVRRFVAERLKCRLQAAPGIRLWLWEGQAALISTSRIPLAGFLYGSAEGHRAGLSFVPWGTQVVSW